MKPLIRIAALASLLTLAGAASSAAHEIKAGNLLLTQLWSRATPAGAKVAAAYLTIENKGAETDRIVSVSSPVGKPEIHEMATTNGVMTMRPLEKGLEIGPGKSVTLAPGGYHVMITDLNRPLKEGEMLPVTLQFEKAGSVEATFHIRGVGAKGPEDAGKPAAKEMDHSGHSGMKM